MLRCRYLMLAAAGLLAWSCDPPAQDDLEGDALGTAGAHEHGIARLDLAVDGPVLTAELEIPGVTAFGFEHEPTTDDDRRAIARAIEAVERRFDEALVLDPEYGCSVVEASARAAHEDEEHAAPTHDDEERAHSDESGEEHAELRGRIVFRCQRDPTGSEARLAIRELFAAVEHVDLQVISTDRQTGRRVDAHGVRFRL
jgi:hypothetical protein